MPGDDVKEIVDLPDDAEEEEVTVEDEEAEEEMVQIEDPAEEITVDEVEEAASETSDEPTFTLAQLKPYCAQLFGHGFHVLRGAVSAGFVPDDRPITKSEAAQGMEQYLEMPVESKET